MKKIIIAVMVVAMMTSTIGFCFEDTDPNPPIRVAPIGITATGR